MTISAEDVLQYLDKGPQCIATLCSNSGSILHANSTFESHMGPLFKFKNCSFWELATEKDDGKELLRDAIEHVRIGNKSDESKLDNSDGADTNDNDVLRKRLRNVEMISLAKNIPMKCHFDWSIGKGADGAIILFGDKCNDKDEEAIERDAEFIDFFDNAPIAMHWLSGEGIVLWANKTEMMTLGYTEEEYIGQPIMKFCPDEEELVLEIFKNLGSGNSIKDVPVRFRTKSGKIAHLLIDSNIRYNPDGSFGHTRCFIRDDTARKIQEARATLLLEETSRSLANMDNFMSKTFHHVRTPLHIMVNTGDLVKEKVMSIFMKLAPTAASECMKILDESSDYISGTLSMVENTLELVKYEQGILPEAENKLLNVKDLVEAVFTEVPNPQNNIKMSLIIEQNTPAVITSDKDMLKRVLLLLLNNAVRLTTGGEISLICNYEHDRSTFKVEYTHHDPNLSKDEENCGTLPSVFQKPSGDLLIQDDLVDFDKVNSLRQAIEQKLKISHVDWLEVDTSLTYHLVSALGCDLRYFSDHVSFKSANGITKYWFSLPSRLSRHAVMTKKFLSAQNVDKATVHTQTKKRRMEIENPKKKQITEEKQAHTKIVSKVSPKVVKGGGIFASSNAKPLVLVVEDTVICARLVCKQLSMLGCITAHAINGKVAIEMLQDVSVVNTYDLILMDLRMPVMDGFEATEIIRKELKLDIPIYALTGESGEGYRNRADELGFTGFFNKPLRKAKLGELVNSIVTEKKASCEPEKCLPPGQDSKESVGI